MKIILHNKLAPGDIIVATGLLRDLHRRYPNQYLTDYRGTSPEVFNNNPYITPLDDADPEVTHYTMTYNFIHQSNQQRKHFLYGYIYDFNAKFNTDVKLTELKPDLYLSEEEKNNPIIKGNYWVVASGGKNDFTAKWWDPLNWQDVVNQLKDEVHFVQVGKHDHFHPLLTNTMDFRDKTTLRDLLRIIYHSQGVCCLITCFMHIAAAFNKPCVVIAGGREQWWWEAYTRKNRDLNLSTQIDNYTPPDDDMVDHTYLHTMGKLVCCKSFGCWKSLVEGENKKKCVDVKKGPSILQPKCMTLIKPDDVVKAVRHYINIGYAKKEIDVPKVEPKFEALKPPVTIMVLMFGHYVDLHKRVITSIVKNTKPEMYQLRIGLNAVCKETMTWLRDYFPKNKIKADLYYTKDNDNIKKYPMWRKMFYDPDNPVKTKWLIWLDDDSYVTEPDWLDRLSLTIAEDEPKGYVCYGRKYYLDVQGNQEHLVKSSQWYKGKELETYSKVNKVTKEISRRKKFTFANGGFLAIRCDVLRQLNWPDPKLLHCGGDSLLGEALRQNDYNIKNYTYGFAGNKSPRRGYSELPLGVK